MESPSNQMKLKAAIPKKAFIAPRIDQHEKLARLTFDVSTGGGTNTGNCGGMGQMPCP